MVKAFRVVGYFEAISFLILLLIAMPLKYIADLPQAVKFVGMTHGLLFMAYVLMAVVMVDVLKWSRKTLVFAVVGAVLPAGTIVFDRKFMR